MRGEALFQRESSNSSVYGSRMKLTRLPDVYSVCRLPASDAPPCWLFQESSSNAFCSMTKTADELSIVCQQDLVPTSYKKAERNWNVFKVESAAATL